LKRLAFTAAFAALLTGVIAMTGSAASFVDSTPCPAAGPLLVCPTGQVGQPYNIQLLARGGCDLYRWEIVNGALPPGLKMASDGKVTGIPTSSTETIPWVWVHDLLPSEGGYDWCIGDNHSERQFVFRVAPGLSILQNSVPGGTIGQPYSQQLSAESIASLSPRSASPASATWSIDSGSLPPGVNFSSSGLLSGTPTSEGSYTFVVRATGGGNTTDTETETLVVRQPLLMGAKIPKGEVGMPFTVTPSATGGSGVYTWSTSKGALPAGVALANDGTISGTPTLPGSYAFTLTVTDSESRSKSVDVTLVVKAKLAFKTLTLKNATARVAYRAKIAMTGGVAPLTWTARGKIPKGFKIAKTGLLFGTPTKAGTYRITVTVTDSLGAVAKKTLTLVVK
jgi:large repetitive protein